MKDLIDEIFEFEKKFVANFVGNGENLELYFEKLHWNLQNIYLKNISKNFKESLENLVNIDKYIGGYTINTKFNSITISKCWDQSPATM